MCENVACFCPTLPRPRLFLGQWRIITLCLCEKVEETGSRFAGGTFSHINTPAGFTGVADG